MYTREPKYLMQEERDSIIGIGGGAALDVARAITLTHKSSGRSF